MVLGKLDIHMPKMKSNPYFTKYTNINSRWIKDINISLESIKLLEDNIGGNVLDIDIGNDFLNLIPKAKATKAKINKWDCIKILKFLHSKGNYQQNEKTTYWMEENTSKLHIW